MSGPLMDEVDVDAVEFRAEVIDRIQLALLCASVEAVHPICKQLFKIIKVSPLVPRSAWGLIRASAS